MIATLRVLKHLDANQDAGRAADRIRLTDSPAYLFSLGNFSSSYCAVVTTSDGLDALFVRVIVIA